MSAPGYISNRCAVLTGWICASLALAFLLLRLGAHCYRHRRLDLTANLVLASIAVLLSRVAANSLVLKWGSFETPEQDDPALLRAGSICVLVARVLVTTYYWLQSVLLLLFYRELLAHIAWVDKCIKACWGFVLAAYIAVILVTLLECRPISLYWSPVESSDTKCLQAYVQLLLQAIGSLIIDVFLLIISIPILQAQFRTFPRNLQLGIMYSLGLFCIVVIASRLHFVYKHDSEQNVRSFWASIQVVVTTFVANGPAFYGTVRSVRRRRSSTASLARIRNEKVALNLTTFLDTSPSP
jgi:hypothetical protein